MTLPALATRKSTMRALIWAEKLPSCGLRFSVMSMSDSTLKILTTASPMARVNGTTRGQDAVNAQTNNGFTAGGF